jgi:hypothetical protein
MDPSACLIRFLVACTENNVFEATAALSDLQAWVKRQDFLPEVNELEVEDYPEGTVFQVVR